MANLHIGIPRYREHAFAASKPRGKYATWQVRPHHIVSRGKCALTESPAMGTHLPRGVLAPSSSPTWQVRRWRPRGGDGIGMATPRWRTCHVVMGEGWQRRDGNVEVATPRGDGSGMATPRWRWDRERDREAKVATGAGSGSESGGGDGFHTSHVPNIARGALSTSPRGVLASSSSPTWQVRRWRRRGGDGSRMAKPRWRRHLGDGVEVAYLPHHLVPRASAEVATPRWRRERQVRHVASVASPYSPTWQVLRWRREQQVRHVASAASLYSPTWQVRRWQREREREAEVATPRCGDPIVKVVIAVALIKVGIKVDIALIKVAIALIKVGIVIKVAIALIKVGINRRSRLDQGRDRERESDQGRDRV
ncbi:hypothetical protein CBR_g36728 [Chara braunii]|uniref:Uncharacterized protein n=1 Tax=Chara braunii TaxID=69332 RepID=A0A388LLA2_CHABU|nr:hypothetical protein CBR_g36728 [Chara braunii]|eukprot:GBG83110.1 hypothetical protein CBR_g36728 [Chara braunii]